MGFDPSVWTRIAIGKVSSGTYGTIVSNLDIVTDKYIHTSLRSPNYID